MIETMMTQTRPDSTTTTAAISSRRAKGRRESKVAYRNAPGYSTRSISLYTSSPEDSFSRHNDHLRLQTPAQPLDLNSSLISLNGYFNVHRPSAGNSNFAPIVHQTFPDDPPWLVLPNSYTLGSISPDSPLAAGRNGLSPRSENEQLPTDNQDVMWNSSTPRTSYVASEMDDMSMSDMPFGSVGSFNSMVFSTPNTATSSISDSYNFPIINSAYESPDGMTVINDLALPEQFYQTGPIYDQVSPGGVNPTSPLLQDDFQFENDSQEWSNMNLYNAEAEQWAVPNLGLPQQDPARQISMLPPIPWNSEIAQYSEHQLNATPGVVTFEPPPGTPYSTHIARQEFLETVQSKVTFGPEPVSPAGDSDSDSWIVPSYPSSYAASHGSPHSHSSPPAQLSSPPRHEFDQHHTHMFLSTTKSGISKTKLPRGRQRGLTAIEKKQARDVREAKACWACHISKTKCSPCSPGKPCEQCARLAGKRRFCLFSCFNDPLESLSTFLVPDYLMGHFTKANVETFVNKNAKSWGTQYMFVRMNWGYRRFLEASVVALALRSDTSEMAFQHQAIPNGTSRPILIRKQSPPLGIPLAAMDDMQENYSRYIQNIVQSDFLEYVLVAYIGEDSDLAEEILQAVGSFYNAGNGRDSESDLLRRALEMHVTAVILERSLVLDDESLYEVQTHLRQEFPERSAPRCAQRQIKLAFFLLQQRRILKVLKDWGSMMWATNSSTSKDKEWALAFSVFIVLILVMDKTLGAAYLFCEGRIQHHGYPPERERMEFEKLVRLTQKELFDRCKEIFHWKFKTRKGGKEACNPIRDGVEAFQGKSKYVDPDVAEFVGDLRNVVGKYEPEIRHKLSSRVTGSEYTDPGRLACFFLDDFLGR